MALRFFKLRCGGKQVSRRPVEQLYSYELMGNGGDSCCKEVMRGEEEYAGGS